MATPGTHDIDDILRYWFPGDGERGQPEPASRPDSRPDSKIDLWFSGTPEIDHDIRTRFGHVLGPAGTGELDAWADTPRGRLALIIVLDQFSRNIHRGDPRAFQYDGKAQSLCLTGIERDHDRALALIERYFMYMPLEHAEDLERQNMSVRCFKQLLDECPADRQQIYQGGLEYAERHQVVIARFGRFPHRNQVLGRESTPEETEYLSHGKWF